MDTSYITDFYLTLHNWTRQNIIGPNVSNSVAAKNQGGM